MRKVFLIAISALVFFSGLLFYNCSKITGKRPANMAPEIAFANIPPDSSTVSTQPTVYWFGKDIDGYVAEYQYVVVTDSQIAALGLTLEGFKNILHSFGGFNWVPSCSLWADSLEKLGEARIRGISLVTERGQGETNAQIQLFASPDSTVFIKQYIFLRAVDNLGLPSDSTLYRLFSRNNHAPNTKILNFKENEKEVQYSLAETTATWKGIIIAWSGSDSADYPRAQPTFEYYLELYGPFGDTTQIDRNNPDPNKLVYDTAWVTWTSAILPGPLETGYYLFRVRARDDALIPDPTPATTVFLVIRPTFDKDILVMDLTFYVPAPFGYELDSAKVRIAYQNIFAGALHPISDADYIRVPPRESLLSQYRMIVLINQDLSPNSPSETTYSQIAKYLSVGGKLWLIGINNFNVVASFPTIKDLETNYRREPKWSYFMGFNYCGIKEAYLAHWVSVGDSEQCPPLSPACEEIPHDAAFYKSRNEEFIGADPLLSDYEYPTLEIDTVKIKALTTKKSGKVLIFDYELPGVDYNTIRVGSPPAEALYLFRSFRGSSSPLHGKPCAIRYSGPLWGPLYPDPGPNCDKYIYKTAEFTFPLFYINEIQASSLISMMLQWFDLTPCPSASWNYSAKTGFTKGG